MMKGTHTLRRNLGTCLLLLLAFIVGCGEGSGTAKEREQRAAVPEIEPVAKQDEVAKPDRRAEGSEGSLLGEKSEPAPMRTLYVFDEEVDALGKAAACSGMKKTAGSGGFGPLAGCIEGGAETAKLFVNGAAGSREVENVKVMWNDWFKDVGYGLHPDRAEAQQLLEAVVSRYVPARLDNIKQAFFNQQALSENFEGFGIAVTHDQGPAIEEHLLILTFPGH